MKTALLSPENAILAPKLPFLRRFKALLRAQNGLGEGQGTKVKKGVVWVKKLTFFFSTQEAVFEVGEPEKRNFKPLRACFEQVLPLF